MKTQKSILKKFSGDKYYPYTYSILFLIITLLYYYFVENNYFDFFNFQKEKLTTFSTAIITVISIFIGFIGVGITIIFQNKENSNIKMIRANKKYNLLLDYFKEPIIFGFIGILFSIIIIIGLKLQIYCIILYISYFVFLLLLNYRIIHFLFKILKDN